MTLNRHSTYTFPNGRSSKNRIVVPPMASQTANTAGFATQATLDHYARLASSSAGIVFVEYSYVHLSGKGESNQLGVDSQEKIPGLKKIVDVIHHHGALAGIQLVHVGGKSTHELTGGDLQGPSGILVPVKGWTPDLPRELSTLEIQKWLEWFQLATQYSYEAGFDIVELHAAHGYGLNQFLSPLTNQRMDRYGGSLPGRMKLLAEIVGNIKAQFPTSLLAARLPGQDNLEGGLSLVDMQYVVKNLEAQGLDLIDVSSGIGSWRRPEGSTGQGYLVADATHLRKAVSLPVIGVGGIENGDFIDQLLENSQLDFAAVGRAILKNPVEWREAEMNKDGKLGHEGVFIH